MRRTSSPGRAERHGGGGEGGSILLDALVALLIAALALTAALGGLALAARTAGRRWEQARALVGARNDAAADRPVLFEER
jgi:type II secretory pathway pseudopilin PulG